MNVRVADAAVKHLYFNFVAARFRSLELDALQTAVRVLCGITQGFNHGIASQLVGDFEHSYLLKKNSTLQKYSLQPYFGWSTTQLDSLLHGGLLASIPRRAVQCRDSLKCTLLSSISDTSTGELRCRFMLKGISCEATKF